MISLLNSYIKIEENRSTKGTPFASPNKPATGMAIVETFFRNSNFVVLPSPSPSSTSSPPPPRPPPSPPPPLPPLPCPLPPCQLFANLFATRELSDTYHDPSHKVPKNYYWNADPPIFFFRGGFAIRQPTLIDPNISQLYTSLSHPPFLGYRLLGLPKAAELHGAAWNADLVGKRRGHQRPKRLLDSGV